MKNKGGQFYFIATIIFVTMIIGFVSVSNIQQKSETKDIENIKEEFEIEGQNILEFGAKQNYNDIQIQNLWENFTKDYINTISLDIKIILITGKATNLKAKVFEKGTEPIDITTTVSGVIQLSYEGNTYTFPLKSEGENFYFIIIKEGENEIYTVTN